MTYLTSKSTFLHCAVWHDMTHSTFGGLTPAVQITPSFPHNHSSPKEMWKGFCYHFLCTERENGEKKWGFIIRTAKTSWPASPTLMQCSSRDPRVLNRISSIKSPSAAPFIEIRLRTRGSRLLHCSIDISLLILITLISTSSLSHLYLMEHASTLHTTFYS